MILAVLSAGSSCSYDSGSHLDESPELYSDVQVKRVWGSLRCDEEGCRFHPSGYDETWCIYDKETRDSYDARFWLADSERRKKQGSWRITIYAELSGNFGDFTQDADDSGCDRVFVVTSVHFTEHRLKSMELKGRYPRGR